MVADRVKETTISTGTGTINLDGAASGFQGFVAGIGTGKKCYYSIVGTTEWEVGIGTVTDATPDTLSRDTVLASSNSDALVNFSAGTKDVFVTIPKNAIELPSANLISTDNAIIPTGNGSIVPDQYEIADGHTLEIQNGAVMEIT